MEKSCSLIDKNKQQHVNTVGKKGTRQQNERQRSFIEHQSPEWTAAATAARIKEQKGHT